MKRQLNPTPFIWLMAVTSVAYAFGGERAAIIVFAAWSTLMAMACHLP